MEGYAPSYPADPNNPTDDISWYQSEQDYYQAGQPEYDEEGNPSPNESPPAMYEQGYYDSQYYYQQEDTEVEPGQEQELQQAEAAARVCIPPVLW